MLSKHIEELWTVREELRKIKSLLTIMTSYFDETFKIESDTEMNSEYADLARVVSDIVSVQRQSVDGAIDKLADTAGQLRKLGELIG